MTPFFIPDLGLRVAEAGLGRLDAATRGKLQQPARTEI